MPIALPLMNDPTSHFSQPGIPQSITSASVGMIIREKESLNLEMRFGSLDATLTPVETFFIRSHFAVPDIPMKTWRLKIEGEVENPLELTFEELKKIKNQTLPVTLECASNGRAILSPQVKGAQWRTVRSVWHGLCEVEITKVELSRKNIMMTGADTLSITGCRSKRLSAKSPRDCLGVQGNWL